MSKQRATGRGKGGAKAVKGWGVLTPGGRLRHEIWRVRRTVPRNQGDTIVRVVMASWPVPARRKGRVAK